MDLSTLRAAFSGRLHTQPEDTGPFLTDWRGKWTGKAIAVAQPDSPTDAAAVVRWCVEHGVPVVPQGGNTGLSGGSTPDTSGRALVLSLSRLKQVRQIDPINNTIEVEAGVTLQEVQEAAASVGRLFPLSLAAEGTCTIGGNLATNAGGVQVLRYGNARDLCLGLQVVTAEGELWNGLRGLRKDNTGYDLRNLYIGSEGTLGVITAAVLKLYPQPAAQVVAFVAVATVSLALDLLRMAQDRLGPSLTAFELISDECISLVEKHVASGRRPLSERTDWYVLLEVTDMRDTAMAASSIEGLLEQALEEEVISDAAISTNLAQFQQLWAMREDISEAQAAEGKTIKHDVSVPISNIPEFIDTTHKAVLAAFPKVRMVVFGHLGDGNLHYNVSPAADALGPEHAAEFVAHEGPMNRLVHDAVIRYGGSISAEHGLGVLRRDESARYKTAVEIKLMGAVKRALDPRGLMNPGKVLPEGLMPSGSGREWSTG